MENLHPHFMPDVSCCWVEIHITERMILSSCDKIHNCEHGCDQCKPPTNKKKQNRWIQQDPVNISKSSLLRPTMQQHPVFGLGYSCLHICINMYS